MFAHKHVLENCEKLDAAYEPKFLDSTKRRRTFSGNYKDMHRNGRTHSNAESLSPLSSSLSPTPLSNTLGATNTSPLAINDSTTKENYKKVPKIDAEELIKLAANDALPRLGINGIRRASDCVVKV